MDVSLVLVAHAYNPSTREAETGRSLWVQSQPGLQSKSQDRLQSYTEKTCVKKTTTKKTGTWMPLGMGILNCIDISLTDEIIAINTCLVLRSAWLYSGECHGSHLSVDPFGLQSSLNGGCDRGMAIWSKSSLVESVDRQNHVPFTHRKQESMKNLYPQKSCCCWWDLRVAHMLVTISFPAASSMLAWGSDSELWTVLGHVVVFLTWRRKAVKAQSC